MSIPRVFDEKTYRETLWQKFKWWLHAQTAPPYDPYSDLAACIVKFADRTGMMPGMEYVATLKGCGKRSPEGFETTLPDLHIVIAACSDPSTCGMENTHGNGPTLQ